MAQGLSAASLKGVFAGCRSVHVPTTGNHPRDTWVVMYETDGETLSLPHRDSCRGVRKRIDHVLWLARIERRDCAYVPCVSAERAMVHKPLGELAKVLPRQASL